MKQVAVADRLVLTKTVLVDRAGIAGVRAAVVRYNPTAPLIETPNAALAPDGLFAAGMSDSPSGGDEAPG